MPSGNNLVHEDLHRMIHAPGTSKLWIAKFRQHLLIDHRGRPWRVHIPRSELVEDEVVEGGGGRVEDGEPEEVEALAGGTRGNDFEGTGCRSHG
jgi:hypothetical protein